MHRTGGPAVTDLRDELRRLINEAYSKDTRAAYEDAALLFARRVVEEAARAATCHTCMAGRWPEWDENLGQFYHLAKHCGNSKLWWILLSLDPSPGDGGREGAK